MKPHQESTGNINKITTTTTLTTAVTTKTISNNKNTNNSNNPNTSTNNVDRFLNHKSNNKCKLVKSVKPLVNYKFYLDIERHNNFLKIESKILELGGSIEFFLTKDITHFITDKKEAYNINNCSGGGGVIIDSYQSPVAASSAGIKTPQTPQTPNYLSPTVKTPSSNDLKANSKIRSRADAMLHRARKGTCETISDNNRKLFNTVSTSINNNHNNRSLSSTTSGVLKNPSLIAKSWGTPVWHTEYALKFLEKICSIIKERYNNPKYSHHRHHHNSNKKTTALSLKNKSKSAQIFKGNYIKIESSQKQYYRPYYKIFTSKWPIINLSPNKKGGVFPITSAINENYIYDSETKTIKKQNFTNNKTTTINIGANLVKNNIVSPTAEVAATLVAESPASARTSSMKMTRKTKNIRLKAQVSTATGAVVATTATTIATTATTNTSNRQNLSSDKQCGFCEICRTEYDSLTIHLKSELHLNFVKNDNNFLALDSLIKSSANMDKFLSVNNKTNIQIEANNCDLYSPSKRTSKRILNNGSPIKAATLPPIPPVILHSSRSIVNSDKSLLHRRDIDSQYRQDRQIEILEKTTTLGHTRQTRQQHSQQTAIINNSIILQNNEKQPCESGTVRARRQSAKKINYAEPKEDEENSIDDLVSNYQRKKKSKNKEKEKIFIDSSPATKQLSLPTSLYKVVETKNSNNKNVKNSKEVTTVTDKSTTTTSTAVTTSNSITTTSTLALDSKIKKEQQPKEKPKENEQPSPIIVKIRKVRQSELSVLSGEAVNFMFPKRRVSSEITDIDRQTTSEGRKREDSISSIITSSPNTRHNNKLEESTYNEEMITIKRKHSNSSIINSSLDEAISKKKRRLDLVQCNDHNFSDNEEIEEIPIASIIENSNMIRSSPRLSLQRNPPFRTYERNKNIKKKSTSNNRKKSVVVSKVKQDNEENVENVDEIMPKMSSITEKINEKLAEYKYAFERVPSSELWYKVFERQDVGYEKTFEYYGSTNYRKLPYEMGPLPPSTKTLCTLCHLEKSKSDVDNSKNNVQSTSNNNQNIKELECNHEENKIKKENDDSNTSCNEPTTSKNILKQQTKKSTNNDKAAALLSLEMPRKSPREHASTLAILSCLLQRKIAHQRQHQDIKPSTSSSPRKNASSITETKNKNDSQIKLGETNQICTQISENVKRLRRGERASISIYKKSSSLSSPTKNLYDSQKKNNLKQKNKNKTNKLSLSSPSKKKSLQFDIDEKRLRKSIKQDKYVNVAKLKKEIDNYLISPISNDYEEDFDLQLSNDQILNCNDLITSSNDIDLYELLKKSIDNHNNDAGTSNKNYSNRSYNIYGNSYNFSNRLRLYKMYSANKKRKNKTGWPTIKKRAATRQHTLQQQLLQNNLKTGKEPIELENDDSKSINGFIKSDDNIKSITKRLKLNENVSEHSPITPPESDDNNGFDDENDDCNEDDEDNDTLKDDADTVSTDTKLNSNNHTIHNHNRDKRRNIQQILLPPPSHNYQQHHHNQSYNQHNIGSNERNDISDIFTVSSDSLDTVLDVGSQIKSEDQEEIIASSKCNGNQNHHHCGDISDNIESDENDDNYTYNNTKSLSTPKKHIINHKRVKYSSVVKLKNNTGILYGKTGGLADNERTTNCHNNNSKINLKNIPNNTTFKNIRILIKEKRKSLTSSNCNDEMSSDGNITGSIGIDNSFSRVEIKNNDDEVPPQSVILSPVKPNTSTEASNSISPRRLRKPRGRWYRER